MTTSPSTPPVRGLAARAPRAIARRVRLWLWRVRGRLRDGRLPALPDWTGPATSRPPLLVGGTGRSGTTITAKILAAHPAYHMVPFEVRFLSEPGGLCDLVAGRTSIDRFERRLLGRWYDAGGRRQGLCRITDRPTLMALVRELDRDLGRDPRAAAARLVHRLLDPLAVAAGADGWIEMTPGNARVFGELAALLPEARLVHAVRDGRDVACSVVPLGWGPADVEAALDWWASSLGQAYERGASVPAERYLTVQMEQLLRFDRDAELERLRAFAGLDPDPAMRRFFDDHATAERAHVGRWRDDVPEAVRPAFAARYHRLAAPLERDWGYRPLEQIVDDAGAPGGVDGSGPLAGALAPRPVADPGQGVGA